MKDIEQEKQQIEAIREQAHAKLAQAIRVLLLDLGEEATLEQLEAQMALAERLKREADDLMAQYKQCSEYYVKRLKQKMN